MSVTQVLVAILIAVAIWAVAELAIMFRKTRKSIDEVTRSANEAIDQVKPIITKADGIVDDLQPSVKQVDPILRKAQVTVDEANQSLQKVNGILDDVSSVSDTAANVTGAVSTGVAKVAEGAANATARLASRISGKPAPQARELEDGTAKETESKLEDTPSDGYVVYSGTKAEEKPADSKAEEKSAKSDADDTEKRGA